MKTLCLAILYTLSCSICAAAVPAVADLPYPGLLKLHVDATDTDHLVFRAREEIPAKPGPLTLLYPQWLPGYHAPQGPIDKFAGLVIRANGKTLPWQRDPENVYAFHIEVPQGATTIEAEFQYLSPANSDQGRVVMTPNMLNLQWNTVALYPAGHQPHRIQVAASATLPKGWQFATALASDKTSGDGMVSFKTVDFSTLVDSPIFAGRYVKRLDLDPNATVPVHLNIVADEAKYLEVKPEQLQAHQQLISQAYKLFGAQHYNHYDFLLALSDEQSGIGLEHHRSSENGVAPAYFTEWDKRDAVRELLPHEFTHSWNGKFRRPADLATPNYNVPMGDTLLWVYEGQTQYWGKVLTARSGLQSQQQALDQLALMVATYTNNRPGFSWRNVQDTTNDPTIAQRRSRPYINYLMSEDYYNAGALIWLAVDAKLRDLSSEKKSLDDFAQSFFGVDNGSWQVKTYTFDTVIATLQGLAPYDWARFLRDRLDANAPPLDGLAAVGWKLVYTDKPSESQKNAEEVMKVSNFASSIGLTIAREESRIADVRWDGPAFQAGMAPGGKLIAVNNQAYKPERLADAIKAAQTNKGSIELLVKSGDLYRSYKVAYQGGPKYPHLERIAGTVDRLSAIFAAR